MPHSRSKCMECSQSPTHECLWAEGRGRAWFCDKHWKEWSKEHAGDIVAEHELKNGEVGAKYNQEPKLKKKADNHDGKKTGNGTEVGFFIPLSSELAEQFPSLGDKDHSPPHITFLYVGEVPKEKEELFLATCFKSFEGIQGPVRTHLEGLDYFENPAGEGRIAIVRHRFDHDMSDVRWRLRNALQEAGFTVDDSFPLVYHPHTTLGYLNGSEATYQGNVPEGGFEFNEIEVWGLPKVYQIPFGRGLQRVARDTRDFIKIKKLMDAFVKHLDNLKEPGEAKALAKSADALQKALVFTIENPEHRKVFEEKMRPQIESFRGFLRELAHFSDASDIARFLLQAGGLNVIDALLSNLRGILNLIQTNDTDSEFHLAVGPWHVNFLSAPGQDWTESRIKKIVDVLQEATKRISRAGLGQVLGGLVNAYPTKDLPPSAVGDASAGAAYNPPSDSLNLSAQISGGDLQTIYVIAHELGHRYYFRVLGSRGRASWEDFFEFNKGTPPSLDRIISDWEKFIVSGPGNPEEKQDAAYYLKFLAKKNEEDAHWLILAFNMLAESGDKTYPTLNLLKYRKPDIKMFLHPVTGYSLTNAGELFAETFAHYIINGPRRLPELLRYNFAQAVPQARLASLINRVACRYTVRCADRVGKTFTLNPGDPVLYGKYKNKPGTIKEFKTDEKSGDPVVVVEPYPAGRKQDKELKLFKIRQDDRPRDEVSRVAARYQEKKTVKTKDGEDATVYVYSERQIANRNKAKADRVEKLRKNLDKLRSQVKKDIKSEDPKTRLTALVVGLINDTYERVGNDESAKDGHVGVTGWTPEHVKFSGGKATFTYTGKSGVDHVKETKDADLVHALKEAVKDKKKGDTLFTYEGGRVTAETVNEYLKPFDITAKDIRGLHANREMKERLKAIRSKGGKLPTDKKEREKQLKGEFKEALEGAAEAVGHEPATLKSQYLVPGLEDDFMKDGTVTERMNKKAIIYIKNVTDGEAGDNDLRGLWGILSSLTLYEQALIEDMIFQKEPIHLVWDTDRKAHWYVLRDHVVEPGAVEELLDSGYLEQDADGDIRISDMLEAKESLYEYDLTHPGIVIPDEMKVAAVRKVLATEDPSICAMRLLQVFAKGQGKTASREHEGIPVCAATTLCYDCEEEIRTGTPRVDELELYKMMSVQATKSHAEKEDEVIRDLSRKTPTKKPPRHDLRDEHADPEEKPNEFGAEGDRDLSLNYKRVAARWIARIAKNKPPKATGKSQRRQDKALRRKERESEHKPGDVWQTQGGWSAKNPEGGSHSFKGDSAQDQAKAYAQGGASEGKPEDTGEKKVAPKPKKEQGTPKAKPEVQEVKSPEEWVAQIPNKKIFDEVMKELSDFEAQISGVSNSYELPPIPGVPEGLKTMGQIRELLSRKKELSALVEGKKPSTPKKPPKKPPKGPASEDGESRVPESSSEMKRMFEDAGVSEETISSLQDLPEDQQAAILNAYIKAQDEVNIDLEMLNEDTDQQFIREVTRAYKAIRGGGADVKKTKGTQDSGYEDDEDEDGDLFTFDRKTYTTKLSKSPEEIGRMLALSKAAPQLANPLRVGGKDVDDTPKTDAELTELTQQSYNRFKNLTPNLRAEAAVQMERALKALPKDSPKRDQLNRILDGMTLAAAINNENVAVKGKNLRPELAPSFRVLAKSLERQGRADILLGTVEHYESPESRKIIADALENLRGPEISEMLGGESGPWKSLLKDVDWDSTGDAGQEEIKQMLRRTALDEMTTLQALMETVADDQSADSPVTAEQVRKHMEKWRGDKKAPREMQRALDDYARSCSLGDPQGIKDCREAANRVHEVHFSMYLKELKKLGVELKPGNPVLAQISDALRTGDFSKLDTKYVPAGAQDVNVGD